MQMLQDIQSQTLACTYARPANVRKPSGILCSLLKITGTATNPGEVFVKIDPDHFSSAQPAQADH